MRLNTAHTDITETQVVSTTEIFKPQLQFVVEEEQLDLLVRHLVSLFSSKKWNEACSTLLYLNALRPDRIPAEVLSTQVRTEIYEYFIGLEHAWGNEALAIAAALRSIWGIDIENDPIFKLQSELCWADAEHGILTHDYILLQAMESYTLAKLIFPNREFEFQYKQDYFFGALEVFGSSECALVMAAARLIWPGMTSLLRRMNKLREPQHQIENNYYMPDYLVKLWWAFEVALADKIEIDEKGIRIGGGTITITQSNELTPLTIY